MMEACERLCSREQYQEVQRLADAARLSVDARTAWRIEGTLREFPKFQPVNLWFDYPVHHVDTVGSLKDADADGEQPPWTVAAEKRKQKAKGTRFDKKVELENAVEAANMGQPPTKQQLAEYLGVTVRSVGDRLRAHGGFAIDGAVIVRKAGEE
jgi:hypothetical protein